MASTNKLESKLDEVFAKAPKIPEGGKKWFVEYLPWLSLIGGVFTLWSAYALWHWAHAVSGLVNFANQLCTAYGGGTCGSVSRFSFWVWASIVVLAVEGVLYLLAFPGLKARKKAGWNYLYYGALVNVAYAVVSIFTDNNGFGHFIGAAIGSAIGFWLLFQIRSAYTK
ncbi:MAG: hypothetical protein WC498_02670 [Candidatus Saccharimonadales bacterium]